MSERDTHKAQNFSIYDGMSTEALEEILRKSAQPSSEEEYDADAILYILEVIEERKAERLSKAEAAETALRDFYENYLPCAEDGTPLYGDMEFAAELVPDVTEAPFVPIEHSKPRKRRRLVRGAVVLAAAVVVLVAGSLSASAFGGSFWNTIAQWTKETFGFENPTTPNPENHYEFADLQDALENYEIKENVVPTWVPEGYTAGEVQITEDPYRIKFDEIYSNESSDELLVCIYFYRDGNVPIVKYEKTEDVTVYTTHGIDYYIMENLGQMQAIWINGSNECSITGDLTETELETMIDSIYER